MKRKIFIFYGCEIHMYTTLKSCPFVVKCSLIHFSCTVLCYLSVLLFTSYLFSLIFYFTCISISNSITHLFFLSADNKQVYLSLPRPGVSDLFFYWYYHFPLSSSFSSFVVQATCSLLAQTLMWHLTTIP